MNTETNNDSIGPEFSQRAVSLYGQNEGIDDFPVLKAFQQYIDAEQEKARKRMTGLGIFFAAVLVVVIAVFMILLHGINSRNQSLNDRLVEYAMKEADRRQQLIVQPQTTSLQNEALLKSMTDTLVSIQEKMKENASADSSERKVLKVDKDEADRLERTRALLAEEKRQLEKDRERIHQMEIEQYRRKSYPDLYREDNYSRRSKRNLSDEDIREIIREACLEPLPETRRDADSDVNKTSKTREELDEDSDSAIEYFKDDEYAIPVDVKGSSSKVRFTVPVD